MQSMQPKRRLSGYGWEKTNGSWVHFTNVYVPPKNSKGQNVIKLMTDFIPAAKSAVICGDFNCHSALWDSNQPPDERGAKLTDWAIDKNLTILNNGNMMRINRNTGTVAHLT